MTTLRATRSAPRAPLQQRGQARFDLVLEAARRLLAEQGMAGFSIPALAQRLSFTRASIYNFFPTHYAILNELAKRELLKLEQYLLEQAQSKPTRAWREQVRLTVHSAAKFYDEQPLARMLILGGTQTDESYHAQTVTIEHLGSLSRRMFAEAGIQLPLRPVDVMVLAVDLATACFRHSVLLHGRIVPAYRDEAAQVMLGYLTPYVRPGARVIK